MSLFLTTQNDFVIDIFFLLYHMKVLGGVSTFLRRKSQSSGNSFFVFTNYFDISVATAAVLHCIVMCSFHVRSNHIRYGMCRGL
jgi:hypothetical protein